MPRIPIDQIDTIVAALSDQDKCRILADVLVDAFGEIDDEGNGYIDPEHVPDRVDMASIVSGLRQTFWPDDDKKDNDA